MAVACSLVVAIGKGNHRSNLGSERKLERKPERKPEGRKPEMKYWYK